MKKIFILLLLGLFIFHPVLADEDLWGNYGNDVTGGREAKTVSDEEFEEAIKKIDSKVNRWKNWAEKRKKPKGENYTQSNETEQINQAHGEKSTLPVLSLPVEVKIGDGTIPVGHYQVKGEFINEKPILSLYEAGELVVKIPATETNQDYGKEEILFASWVDEGNNQIKIIYGSLDFNAYALVHIAD